ncbi:15859_t:CDS:2 [Cetraspora pellucida]|uniref:15859_t:CDS:1 n=1 Tax=Cetraspora pellucida TaxID=1433469 RepID=A0ACA9KWF0_9GLOM|nr:15859_t:CDS:2 [Cetraspora pellucida]
MIAKHRQIPLKILAIGTVHEDVILYVDKLDSVDNMQGTQKIEKRFGGSAGNTLAVLSQFPMTRSWVMAPMACKEASKFFIQDFESRNIKTSTCVFRPYVEHPQTTYFIHTDAEDSRAVVNYNSIEELTFEEFKRKFDFICTIELASLNTSLPFNWIHLEGHNADAKKMIDYIDSRVWRNKTIISVRLDKPYKKGLESLMKKADVIFFSQVFAESKGYIRDAAFDFLKFMGKFCKETAYLFCTWGSSGAMFYNNKTKRVYAVSAMQVPIVVDSVGAGDTFVACAIYSLVQGMSPEGCLRFSCELASRKCAQFGFGGMIDEMGRLRKMFKYTGLFELRKKQKSQPINATDSGFADDNDSIYSFCQYDGSIDNTFTNSIDSNSTFSNSIDSSIFTNSVDSNSTFTNSVHSNSTFTNSVHSNSTVTNSIYNNSTFINSRNNSRHPIKGK